MGSKSAFIMISADGFSKALDHMGDFPAGLTGCRSDGTYA